MFKLSIIIVNWNTEELLKQCLASVMNKIREMKGVEVVVVDNGSDDGSPQMVKKEFPKVELIQNKENLGFAKGNNLGFKQARGEYIMLLNSDTVVKERAIDKLVKYLDEHNKVAAVAPLLLNGDGSIQKDPAYLKLPSFLTAFLYYNPIFRKIVFKFFPNLLFSVSDFSKPAEVEQLPGAAMMLRASVLRDIGGLDEDYPHYFEDVDLSFRLRKNGSVLVLVPQAEVVHFGGRSLQPVIKKEGLDKFYFLNFRALFLFCQKNYSPLKAAIIKAVVFSQLLLTGKISLIKKLRQ